MRIRNKAYEQHMDLYFYLGTKNPKVQGKVNAVFLEDSKLDVCLNI